MKILIEVDDGRDDGMILVVRRCHIISATVEQSYPAGYELGRSGRRGEISDSGSIRVKLDMMTAPGEASYYRNPEKDAIDHPYPKMITD